VSTPVHFSIWISVVLGRMPWVFFAIALLGFSRFTQPPRSVDLAGLAHRTILGRGGRGRHHARAQPVGDLRGADHRAAMVPEADQVVVLDAARFRILAADARDR
jgi:hypothetical protein